jgi:hypothetical protein
LEIKVPARVCTSVPRVPAPEIESAVLNALGAHFGADEDREQPTLANERDRIERQLDRVVVQAGVIEIHLAHSSDRGLSAYKNGNLEGATPPRTVFTVPWSGAVFGEVKGILRSPSPPPRLNTEARDVCSAPSQRPDSGSMISSKVGSVRSPKSPCGKARSNATSDCWLRWHSCFRGSSQRSSIVSRRLI